MMDSSVYPEIKGTVKCVNGVAEAIPGNANYTFQCNNVRIFSTQQISFID